MAPEEAIKYVDENTIGIFVVSSVIRVCPLNRLSTPFYPVLDFGIHIHRRLRRCPRNERSAYVNADHIRSFAQFTQRYILVDEYEAKTGQSVPIHVDAASGGFVAPFGA